MHNIFSRDFASNIWGKKAVEMPLDKMLFDESNLFDAICRYSSHLQEIRTANKHSEVVTSVNGTRTKAPKKEFFASCADVTLDDYVTRVKNHAKDDDWCIAYFGIHAANPAMWDAAKTLADQLASALGFRPGGRVDIDCFIGQYSSTYTGIHVDYAHNFAFTLRNGKTMFTWPPNKMEVLGLKSPAYESLKSDCIPLANSSDRVAYFPHDFFHVAESKNSISVNVNIAIWETGSESQDNLDYVTNSLCTPPLKRHDIRNSGLSNLNSNDDYFLKKLATSLDERALKRHMIIRQLIADTSARLNIGRPIVGDFPDVGSVVSMNGTSTLHWAILSDLEEILFAANGHCSRFDFSLSLVDFFQKLSSGSVVDIRSLECSRGGDEMREITRAILALRSWGAL